MYFATDDLTNHQDFSLPESVEVLPELVFCRRRLAVVRWR